MTQKSRCGVRGCVSISEPALGVRWYRSFIFASCTEKQLAFMCSNNESRSFDLVGASVTASFDDPVNPKVISGKAAYTYNSGDSPSAALVVTQSFQNLTRR